MYDACDEHEVRAPLGVFRKRLDARRNSKPKKPDAQKLVCTPFDPNGFNFSKIKNPREKLLKLRFSAGANYEVLTNKFPLFPGHMLLVACHLVPQQMRHGHLLAIAELLQGCSGFCDVTLMVEEFGLQPGDSIQVRGVGESVSWGGGRPRPEHWLFASSNEVTVTLVTSTQDADPTVS